MMGPLFSIVIPVCNVGHFFDACLKSIMVQTGNFECILIDDGSNDGSEKKCDDISGMDPRFRVIHQTNQGVSAARNRGLEEAKGEWIWFIDADDVIYPEALYILSCQIEKTQADFIYFDYIHDFSVSFDDVFIDAKTTVERKIDYIPEMSQWRCVFKRKLARFVRFEHYIVGEDLLFCAKLSLEAEEIGYLPIPLYGYIKRSNSVTHTPSFRRTMDSILWMSQVLQFYHAAGTKYYEHLEKSRWNKFFFVTAHEIMNFRDRERVDLINIWCRELEALKVIDLHFPFSILRTVFLALLKFSFLRQFMIQLNSFVFVCYTKKDK